MKRMGVAKLRVAVCEDESEDIALLRSLIDPVQEQLFCDGQVDYFTRGEDLLAEIRRGAQYDLLILDIFLDGVNGVDAARNAKVILPEIQIAFLSSSRDFAPEAFEINAIHYLVKPADKTKVEELFRRFFERTKLPLEVLEIKSERKSYKFPLSCIQKIQSNNKGVDVYLQGLEEPQRIPTSFIRVEEQLDPKHFLKVSRGLIVQMEYILCINKDTCRFKDGTEALISRRERANIRQQYNDYLFSNLKRGEGRA